MRIEKLFVSCWDICIYQIARYRSRYCSLRSYFLTSKRCVIQFFLDLLTFNAFSFQQCPFDDVTTNRMVTRFKNRLWKKFSLYLEHVGEERYIDEDIRELYQLIGVLIPEHKDVVSSDGIRDSFGLTVRAKPGSFHPRNPLVFPVRWLNNPRLILLVQTDG